jgi:hypothetical protein
MPPSKRITRSAKLLNIGASVWNPYGSITWKTGPSRIPKNINSRLSGIPFLLNRYVPMNPRLMIIPVNMKRKGFMG